MVKHYDVIVFGTGSAMNIVSELINEGKRLRFAVIENNMVGGICLTRGCIPSKMLLEVARNIRRIKEAEKFGIQVSLAGVDFTGVMERVWRRIYAESKEIEHSLKHHPLIDLYQVDGTFVGDYTVDVGGREIEGDTILLCTGSRPHVVKAPGVEEVKYYTNDNFFRELRKLPRRTVVIGGGFVGLELGFFLAMMGSQVTVLQRRERILPEEEPEISELLARDLSRYMDIRTLHEVVEFRRSGERQIVVAENKATGDNVEFEADAILMAAGRESYSDITRPEKTGVKTDEKGWILVDEYLRTTKDGVWAFGDATGKMMFKHKANYESVIVYRNAFRGENVKARYHAVPHAVFTEPEVASVGLKEEEAAKKYDILVGIAGYEETAKGEAMMLHDYFVKVILDRDTFRILGAHIIGPEASILIQEIVNLMYAGDGTAEPIYEGMHIHPALSEVVERAFFHLHEPGEWRRHAHH
ncbi:dihydrolipoyl dehydrogenase [Thermofilum pendens]|uniref:Dihydrolipoamide dehydrogenase n=1 Tax=Thermofilum pendens (strain DSM 2475 / Hrk 5) TaxID=368408 RepID=A1S189_THEPD|nr:dihydrolipoyl dehydrogenase [Thermofilum pendens]ABL79219.1 dihydrolipoamide dehydrogenase [Thermofilum pendens Hrk 5]